MPSTAASKSASANTMPAFLPPSSNDTSRMPSAAAFMIAAPVRGLAGEGDGVDARMAGEELAGRIRTETVHHVVDALGHAHRVHHLAEQRGGLRRLLGRLDHHGVAAGQRRADLPGHQHERRVPRADHADHALGLAHAHSSARRDRPGWPCWKDSLATFLIMSANTLKLAAPRGMNTCFITCSGWPVSDISASTKSSKRRVISSATRVQQLDAPFGGQRAPLALQRLTRRLYGRIDLGGAGFADRANDAIVQRRTLVEAPAAGRRAVFTGNEVFNLAHGQLQ